MLLVVFFLGFFAYSAPPVSLADEYWVHEFDAQEWQVAALGACSGEDNRRLGMVGQLEAVIPKLVTDDLISAMLGTPDRVTLLDDGAEWTYCLGYNIVDFDNYVFRFDAAGTVIGSSFIQE